MVSYRSAGAGWALSVSDDGVGLPSGPMPAKSGLGTSIVEALAAQLRAKVSAVAMEPGTSVRVVHEAAVPASPNAVLLPV